MRFIRSTLASLITICSIAVYAQEAPVADSTAVATDTASALVAEPAAPTDAQVAVSDSVNTAPDSTVTASDSAAQAIDSSAVATPDSTTQAADTTATAVPDTATTDTVSTPAADSTVAPIDSATTAPDSAISAPDSAATAPDSAITALDSATTAVPDSATQTTDSTATAAPDTAMTDTASVPATEPAVALADTNDAPADTTQASWSIIGNVMLGGNYHYVRTRTNHGATEVFGEDSVKHGKRFKNYYQVPGFGGEASAYLLMQGPDGRTIEFTTDLTTDSWNHFSPNPVTIRYNDKYSEATVGDFQMIDGDIYMSGLPIFGAGYTLSLLRNHADQPLLQFNGFFGEAKRSLVPGARHPYMYNDYIEDGEAEAQRLAYGGYFKWAPLRRFDAKIGAIYASDELEDPLLRDGASSSTTTIDPMVDAFTVYAEGNGRFFRENLELNAQIAVGNADTANAASQRALNKVFSDAGVEIASYGKLRRLMKHPEEVNQLSSKELDEILGDNLALSTNQKREKLASLLNKAKRIQKQEDDEDEEEFAGLEWGTQDVALAASLNWNFYKTRVESHLKYVGEDFYSAGSPDQISDVREFGVRVEQGILNIWNLGVEYSLLVENAANGNKTNVFGLGEGTRWGLFPNKESNWFDEHELDNDRTRYTQNAGIDNTFKIGSRIEVEAGYNFEFKKQYRNLQLHGDYILDDEIYGDSWFAPRKDHAIDTIDFGGKKTAVDAERWAEYNALSSAPYLASKFHEKLYKHSWNAGVSLRAAKSVFKVNGLWTLRLDGSEFYKDELIEDMDFSNDTWAKLGYYYGGSNYFEQVYPVSVTTTLNTIQNRFVVTPRYKSYKRDEMKEMEISVTDELEKSFMNRFLILSGSGDFRYMITDWEESGEDFDESEMDILGKINLRVNHTKHLYSEWYTGAAIYYRPDNLSSEYKDVYGGINVNYVF
ncbi:MAG: hypothetical protein MJY78_02850 [Fibrobacter sp.]|nr:hypothetical protein [Fibrobacter sp.]